MGTAPPHSTIFIDLAQPVFPGHLKSLKAQQIRRFPEQSQVYGWLDHCSVLPERAKGAIIDRASLENRPSSRLNPQKRPRGLRVASNLLLERVEGLEFLLVAQLERQFDLQMPAIDPLVEIE